MIVEIVLLKTYQHYTIRSIQLLYGCNQGEERSDPINLEKT